MNGHGSYFLSHNLSAWTRKPLNLKVSIPSPASSKAMGQEAPDIRRQELQDQAASASLSLQEWCPPPCPSLPVVLWPKAIYFIEESPRIHSFSEHWLQWSLKKAPFSSFQAMCEREADGDEYWTRWLLHLLYENNSQSDWQSEALARPYSHCRFILKNLFPLGVSVLHQPGPSEAAHRPLHEPCWGGFPGSMPNVPLPRELLHHWLVCQG